MQVSKESKLDKIVEIVQSTRGMSIIIFVEKRDRSGFLTSYLNQNHFNSTLINGDLPQHDREYALKEFREKKAPILVATNVAARGLDIPEVDLVVNYDLPRTPEE